MSLINSNPRNFLMDVPRWAKTGFDDDRCLSRDGFSIPLVNVAEDVEGYTLDVAVPGMDKNDIRITVGRGVLIVTADVRKSREERESHYIWQEFHHEAYKRAFRIPENVNSVEISAELIHGILKLYLPKEVSVKQE